MANNINNPDTIKYYITYNDDEIIISWGKVEPGQYMETGQSSIMIFNNIEDWEEALLDHDIIINEEDLLPPDQEIPSIEDLLKDFNESL